MALLRAYQTRTPSNKFDKFAAEHLSITTLPRSFCHDGRLFEGLFTLNFNFLEKSFRATCNKRITHFQFDFLVTFYKRKVKF